MQVLGYGWRADPFVLTNDGRLLYEFPYYGQVDSRENAVRKTIRGSEEWRLRPPVPPEAVGATILDYSARTWAERPSIWFASCEETNVHLLVGEKDVIYSCQHHHGPDGEWKTILDFRETLLKLVVDLTPNV